MAVELAVECLVGQLGVVRTGVAVELATPAKKPRWAGVGEEVLGQRDRVRVFDDVRVAVIEIRELALGPVRARRGTRGVAVGKVDRSRLLYTGIKAGTDGGLDLVLVQTCSQCGGRQFGFHSGAVKQASPDEGAHRERRLVQCIVPCAFRSGGHTAHFELQRDLGIAREAGRPLRPRRGGRWPGWYRWPIGLA